MSAIKHWTSLYLGALLAWAVGSYGQQLPDVPVSSWTPFPANVQIYFPSRSTAQFGLSAKKLFLVYRGKVSISPPRPDAPTTGKAKTIPVMAGGRTFVTTTPTSNLKLVAKLLDTSKSAATAQSITTMDNVKITLTATPLQTGIVDVHATAVGLGARKLASDQHTAIIPLISASGRTIDQEARAKGEFNITIRCVSHGDTLIRVAVAVDSLTPISGSGPTPQVFTNVKTSCGGGVVDQLPTPDSMVVQTPDSFNNGGPVTNRGRGDAATGPQETPSIVKYSAAIAAVGLVVTVVLSVVVYLCYQRRSSHRKSSPRVAFGAQDDTVSGIGMARGTKRTASSRSKTADANGGHSTVRQQDSVSYGDVQSQVHTQKSTLSGVTAGNNTMHPDCEDDDDDDRHEDRDEHDIADDENRAESPEGNGTVRPASLNSDGSMSSVTPLITVHATYPWQYHSVFHGCIIDKDRIQIGQIIKQGSYGQVFEGTLGFPERLPIVVKTSTQSAHQEEIQRFAFEAMVLKGAVHKYVHSVVGVCFSSTATNGVPVPPFLVFPMVPGQKSLKDLLLHTRRVAGIRDSGTGTDGGGNGSVGRAAGKMLSTPQLVMMAAQIARGLRHLEKRNIVHKDVAARNCVVLPNLEVRIGDAALSCDLYPNEYHYHFNFGHAKVPLKWMPLECIEDGLFSGGSDVWSFGVTMWEIMTLGSLPFEDVDELEMGQFLKAGNRLTQPRRCPFELFAIMARCWALSPEDRPGFGYLVHCLYTYADSLRCYI